MIGVASEFALQVRLEYEKRVGEEIINVDRHRPMVEHRIAVSNALRPYMSLATIGGLFQKDHSSIVHYGKEHEPLLRFAPSYRNKFATASEVVNDLSKGMDMQPIFHETYNIDVNPRRALSDIDRVIIALQDMKCRILEKQANQFAQE